MASPGAFLAPAPTIIDNANTWRNLSSWINVTRYAPSIEDLVLAGPRMLTRLGSIISFPDAIEGLGQQRVVADPTGSTDFFLTTAAGNTANMAATAADASASVANVAFDNVDQDPSAFVSRFSMESAKGLGSVFSYATSKWALCCVAMAIILNRTHIFAASRRRLRLIWPIRLALRFLPILLFALQARQLLQSIQCQTSPDFAELRWGNSSKTSDLMFAHAGGYLHGVSSTLLMGADDYDSCRAVSMVPAQSQDFSDELRGSLSRLWPLFGTLCLSHFAETISCALQGRPVAVETGMTLFEHSLAFAEADAAISNQLGWNLFSPSTGDAANANLHQSTGPSVSVSRAMILKRVNTPPEVLFVAFLSAMSHVTSHVLGVFGLQSKFRLVNTGVWALCFMTSIVYEAYSFSIDDPSSMGLFRFPTVCIIGFIPHVMVLGGIAVCGVIYSLAIFLAALDPPEQPGGQRTTFRQRLAQAHDNMQANIPLSDIRLSWEMDFYTALLRTGFGVITMASEAVYLNQDQHVNMKQHTWLEEERYKELDELRMQWAGSGLGPSRFDSGGTIGLIPVKENQSGLSNGYNRERAAQKVPKGRMGERRARDGVGASERSSRWLLALDFIMKIFRLVGRWAAALTLKVLARIGINGRPRFLVWLSQTPETTKNDRRQGQAGPSKSRALKVLWKDGVPILLNDEQADVEVEVRKRFKKSADTVHISEEEIDRNLYNSWKHGGLWGGVDTSGEWEPEEHDDDWDTTSLMHSVVDEDESLSDRDAWIDEDDGDLDDGQRTPTQQSPQYSRESTPLDQPINMNDLARLLHPKSPEERNEAHALAAHLRSDRIVTRSSYARQQQSERGQLLTSTLRHRHQARNPGSKMTPEEEAELLEQVLLSRRESAASVAAATVDNDDDESAGPRCVVCQVSSRTIIVWPCRCLSLCDDCRLSLAMNNFDKCVCCRREVISFSRIYVP